MILAALGLGLMAMVGPIDETPVVRISRPGGGAPEFVRQLTVGDRQRGGGVVVPSSAVGGGGEVTIVGASGASDVYVEAGGFIDDPQVLYTEQMMRAFGYDRSHYGFTTIDYTRRGGGWRGGTNGWHHLHRPERPIDPRITSMLRDLAPIESRFPPVPGR